MEGSGSQWSEVARQVIQYTVSALGAAASACVIWFSATLRGHVAMLRRHDELLAQIPKDMGMLSSFKSSVEKGPIGEELCATIEELKAEDEKLHKRVGRRRLEAERLRRALIAMRGDIRNIKESCERIEKK